ncbi:DUF4190 domain-containing protein [Actinomycetospora soli]|uniref:DUF4190 domain-containing protein n=1 Tax=Actinomycetospora soli TaxID=2893887 RepID=UPI001E2E81A4|nr:DUF4190 domain-containing protein [Actinomycetospora soli]MCD2188687.1 DUF4190 domain-containing protein [Actinomycetospora soli]
MTQHLDRPVTPMIDASVDADVTTPAGGTPGVQNPGWPPPTAGYAAPAGTVPGAVGPVAPEPPLNTLSWLSVVSAFVVSPVAIVLGAISRRQIARTGERGRGLATTGIALGIVFTLMGIVSTILVLSMVTTVTYTSGPAPAPAPVPAASSPAPAATAPGTAGTTGTGSSSGQADLLSAYLDLIGANQTLTQNFEAHDQISELKADLAEYRAAVQTFRDTVVAADLPAEQRAEVDARLIPAVDKVLADLDAMGKATTQSSMQAAASAFDTDNPAMAEVASTVISG